MRTLTCFFGFMIFGLILFFAIGNLAVDDAWFDAAPGWAWLVAVGLMIADIVVPVPTTVMITIMGQKYGPILGGAIGTLGSFSSGVIAYGLTRMPGRRFAKWLLREELETASEFFERSGAFAVACSRWLPLFPEAISCVAGLTRMHFGRYCAALLCGAVPMCFGYAALTTVSENQIVPLVISILMPLPIWWIATRLHLRTVAGVNAARQR